MNSASQHILFQSAVLKMPDLAQSVLGHDENVDLNIEIIEKYNLSEAQAISLIKIIQQLFMRNLRPQDVSARIEQDFLLDAQTARRLACDLLGLRGLPLEWYLGPIQPIIKNMGGDPEQYLTRVKPLYPEVFANAPLKLTPDLDPEDEKLFGGTTAPAIGQSEILDGFVERLGSFAGRAEILLRLTGLGTQLEERAASGAMDKAKAEKIIADLDAISNAINTRDLNPFEVQALQRRLTRILGDIR